MKTTHELQIGQYTPSEYSILIRPTTYIPPEDRKAIICLHGHSAYAYGNFVPGLTGPGDHAQALADARYWVLSIDAGGTATWNNDTAMTAITAAYNYLMGLGMSTNKIGIMGWSMGGGNTLQWIKGHFANVAAAVIWAPMTNLPYFYTGNTAEIEAAYGGNYAVNSVGHRISDEYPTWRDKCPIMVIHGNADTVAPYSHSQAFVAGVAQPQVTLTTIAGGTHGSIFTSVPVDTIVDFFNNGDWTDLTSGVPVPSLVLAPESSKYQDYARTTPAVANNDPVSSWSDMMLGNHAVTTVNAARPLLKTNVLNGYDVLQFDGVDDVLGGLMSAEAEQTWFLVAKKVAIPTAATAYLFALNAGASDKGGLYTDTDFGTGYSWFPAEGPANAHIGGAPDLWNIIVMTSDITTQKFWIGGGASVDVAAYDSMDNYFVYNFGANNNVNYGAYMVAEARRFTDILSLADINSFAAGLSAKFAVPWATAT